MKEQKTILLVDKDPGFTKVVRQAAEIAAAKVALAATKEEGLKKAAAEKPDLVILGYLEPRGEAFHFNQELRSGPKTSDIPLLVVDVKKEEQERKGWHKGEGMMMDAEDYLCRPLTAQELAQHIKELLLEEEADSDADVIKSMTNTRGAMAGK